MLGDGFAGEVVFGLAYFDDASALGVDAGCPKLNAGFDGVAFAWLCTEEESDGAASFEKAFDEVTAGSVAGFAGEPKLKDGFAGVSVAATDGLVGSVAGFADEPKLKVDVTGDSSVAA